MYVPPEYRVDSAARIRALMRGHPLALLLTPGQPVPQATHLPVIPAGGDDGALEGQVLWGHMNRNNPHWPTLTEGSLAKLVFSGPGAYVTPALYDPGPAAPTWDFATVHLVGRLSLIEGRKDTLKLVRRTAALLESSFGQGWSMQGSLEYFESIVDGVGAFAFTVESVEAMFKLSQDKPDHIRQRVRESFGETAPGTTTAQLAQLMGECGTWSGSNGG